MNHIHHQRAAPPIKKEHQDDDLFNFPCTLLPEARHLPWATRRKTLSSSWRFYPLLTATAFLYATVSLTAAFSSQHVVVTSQQRRRQSLQQQQQPFELLLPSTCYQRSSSSSATITAASSAVLPRRLSRPWVSLRLSDNSNSEAFSDEEEWRAILAAFRMYKAAYGDLKVPSRFVVPSLPPWPENAWGLKLGHRVAAIRATGRFVKDQPDRLRALEKLGFQWQLRSGGSSSSDGLDGVTLDQIYTALATYRREIQPTTTAGAAGPLSVPPTFLVPNSPPWPESTRGLPLGKLLPLVRSKAFLKANPEAKERLEALDVELDGKTAMNDARFQKVYEALKRYREIHGDLLVPQPFVVPSKSDEWADDLWGLRLGARVNAIRSQGTFVTNNPERKKLLDDLGFVWSPPPSTDGGKKRGRRSKAELENERIEFGKRSGDDNDDLDFNSNLDEDEEDDNVDGEEGDDDDDDPSSSSLETWFGQSFDFGSSSMSDGSQAQAPPTWGLQQGSAQKLSDTLQSTEDTSQVTDEFLNPPNLRDNLKEAFDRAVEVGVIEPVSEGKRVKKGKREKDIPWFNDDFGEEFVFEDVVEALTIYKSMYGDFSNLTQGEFVVPAGGNGNSVFGDFPEDEEFDVEASSRAAAAIAAYRKRNQLAESEELIESEIRRLQGNVASSSSERNVAAVQLKSSTAVEWPEHLAGMALGSIVTRIRDGSLEVKHLPERKAQLDALDFDWGDPRLFIDIPFEKAMCAMYAYYLVRGDLFVYESFVIPDEDPWPKVLAGYEIGVAVKRLREQQYFLEAYHPEKVSLLRMIDFMWFPTAALPLDPNEPEMTPEMLLLSAMGHPDYAKMIDIPMGLPDKIIADGPFYDSDDPKYWWRKWHNWEYVKDYWYLQGRRDNAFVLRGMGYPQMAEEHEAIYGPGLFKQLDQVMKELEDGIEGRTQEEKEDILAKLGEIRDEMVGCTDIHPQDRAKLIDDLEAQIQSLLTAGTSDVDKISRFSTDVYLYEEPNGDGNEANGRYEEVEESKATEESRAVDEDDDADFDDSDDIDVEEELGLFQ